MGYNRQEIHRALTDLSFNEVYATYHLLGTKATKTVSWEEWVRFKNRGKEDSPLYEGGYGENILNYDIQSLHLIVG